MIKSIVACLMMILFFFLANASHKDVGGGNGVAGRLLDRHMYVNVKSLDRNQLYRELISEKSFVLKRFPFLKDISFSVIQSKTWILDDRKLSFECVNPTAYFIPKKVWACQNSTEVRISKKFWSHSKREQRTDLIFHEVMTALWLNSGNQKPINLAVASLLDLTIDQYEVQRRVFASGLPVLLTVDQVNYFMDEMLNYARMSCQLKNESQEFSKWSARSAVRNENGLFLYAVPFVLRLKRDPCFKVDRREAYEVLWKRFKELNSEYLWVI